MFKTVTLCKKSKTKRLGVLIGNYRQWVKTLGKNDQIV